MENLQIEAGYVFKLVILCCSGVAYYFYLNKSIGILNERLKMNKRFLECTDKKVEDNEKNNCLEHQRIYDKLDKKQDKRK